MAGEGGALTRWLAANRCMMGLVVRRHESLHGCGGLFVSLHFMMGCGVDLLDRNDSGDCVQGPVPFTPTSLPKQKNL